MSDLLPPSPSIPTTNMKPYFPTPSPLGLDIDLLGPSAVLTAPSPLPQIPSPGSHTRNNSLVAPSPLRERIPEIHPLDFGTMIQSHEETHAGLGRIVEDLSQWLSITEAGLNKLLESASEDRIEEEQEDNGPSKEGMDMDRSLHALALATD